MVRLVFAAAVLVVAAAKDVGECGGWWTGARGTIDFKRFHIPAGTMCRFIILAPDASSIKLTFNRLFLSPRSKGACKQMLLLAAGASLTQSLIPKNGTEDKFQFCGRRSAALPGALTLGADRVEITLVALYAARGKGFSISWEADMPEPVTPPPPPPGLRGGKPEACTSLFYSSLGRADCDLTTEGGPWVIVQRRSSDDGLFGKSFDDYWRGFGDLSGSHWLGLNAMSVLCNKMYKCKLRIEITYEGEAVEVPTQQDGKYVAHYIQFHVEDGTYLYSLNREGVFGYEIGSSNAGDALMFTWRSDFIRGCDTLTNPMNGWWTGGCKGMDDHYGKWSAFGGYEHLRWALLSNTKNVKDVRVMVKLASS